MRPCGMCGEFIEIKCPKCDPKDTKPPEPRSFPPRIFAVADYSKNRLIANFSKWNSLYGEPEEYLSVAERDADVAAARSEARAEALDAAISGLGEIVRHQGYEFIPTAGVFTDPWRDKCYFAHERLMALKNKLEALRAKEARLPGKGVERPGEEK